MTTEETLQWLQDLSDPQPACNQTASDPQQTCNYKWKWIQDLTKEKADGEEDEKKRRLLNHIADGFEWMREEERVGKWLGLILAIVFWFFVFFIYYLSH